MKVGTIMLGKIPQIILSTGSTSFLEPRLDLASSMKSRSLVLRLLTFQILIVLARLFSSLVALSKICNSVQSLTNLTRPHSSPVSPQDTAL
jgi:hypothetical protein